MRNSKKRPDLNKMMTMKGKEKFTDARDWYVQTCPPNNSLKGTIVPEIMSYRRRRISVEVYKKSNSFNITNDGKDDDGDSGFYEACYFIMMNKVSQQKGRNEENGDGTSISNFNRDEYSICRQSSVMQSSFDGWEIRYKFPLKSISIENKKRNSATFGFQHQGKVHQRKIKFDTEDEMKECTQHITDLLKEETSRLNAKYETSIEGLQKSVMSREVITFLVEIVGGIELPAGDIKSSDPYVVCYYDGAKVHKTKHISKDLNPIFTLKHKNLFLIDTAIETLFKGDGLSLEVTDFDQMGKDDKLGTCNIPPRIMYEATGERLSLELENREGKGTLHLRIRHATENDKKFIKTLEEQKGFTPKKKNFLPVMTEVLEKANYSQGGKGSITSMMARNEKFEKSGMGPPVKKYRVRPGSDPKRPEETEWLSEPQLCSEMMKESNEWIDIGTGRLGRLFVEVIEATDLPNMDSGGFAGNKTDSFCCLIYGDCSVKTDVIDDCLRPKWMPWTKRAFIFNIAHPSAELFVGLFDYDKLDMHDLLGRISIDITNLEPDIIYDLTYKLYPSANLNERIDAGKLRLRLRVEIDDDRSFLLSSAEPPNTIYVNVQTKKDFDVIHKIIHGNVNMEKYSLKNVYTYIDELYAYQNCILYIKEAFITLLFWRGHYAIDVMGHTYLLPLHSMVAFSWAITVVEYPQLIPSFSFFMIAWLMFATMMFRRTNPNRWHRCKSFLEMSNALIYGGFPAPEKIASCQNRDAVDAYEKMWMKKIERESILAKEAEEVAEEVLEEEGQLADAVDGSDITTKRENGAVVAVDPIRPFVEPIHVYLAVTCHWLRCCRNVILWQECYLSFWITMGSLVLSFACLFIPWFFIIRWTSRIVAWTLFGPWMMLVDIHYWVPMENMSEEDRIEEKEKARKMRKVVFKKQIEEARTQKEKAKKLKQMKRYIFGKFIAKVPVLKEDRHWDVPLAESSATLYKPKPLPLAEVAMMEAGYHRVRLPGQQLEGDMIPVVQSTNTTEAPIGQATKKHAKSESDTAAYTKVGSVVVGAALITYFGVPLLASLGASVFGS